MKKAIILFIILSSIGLVRAQTKLAVDKTIKDLSFWSNNVIPIESDSNCSSFLIRIEEEVKPHYHANHTENIYVVNGSATLMLGDSLIKITKGDLIVIPPKTVHSVKVSSLDFLEVLSIQSPEFKGEDRVFIE